MVINNEGNPLEFEKINIIYGRNYSGKTTLSRILRAMETGEISDKFENPVFTLQFSDGSIATQSNLKVGDIKIRVFNEDFVRENLRFINNPDDSIEPFAILGNDNNKLESEIASLENELGSNEEGKETGLYAQLKTITNIYKELQASKDQAASGLNNILANKATGRNSGIKYNMHKFGDPNYNITKLKNDIKCIQRDDYSPLDMDKKYEYEQLLNENIKPEIRFTNNLKLNWETFCEMSKELLSRKVGTSNKISELLLDIALNEWVKRGYELHNNDRNKDTCRFCNNTITDERWKELHAHFDEESRRLEEGIDRLIYEIQQEITYVKGFLAIDKGLFYSKFHQKVEKISEKYSDITRNYIEQLNKIIEQLTQRRQNITVSIPFKRPEDYSSELKVILSKYEVLCKESNEFSDNLTREQLSAREALRLNEVHDFCKTIGYSDIVARIEKMENETEKAKENVQSIQSKIDAIEVEIQEKKRQLNDEEKGAIQVNKYLNQFFGHNFLSLQAIEDESDEVKRIRFEIIRNGKRAYHLSEGECSLIAFCYFMAKLNDIETKDTKPIIWIDDPISSLDGNHIFFVYSLIVAEIADKNLFSQLFISTHNLDFLKYLRRLKSFEKQKNGKYKECGKQYFIINRNGQYSELKKMPKYLKEYGTEFNYLFSCIHRCSLITTIDDSNYELFYNFGNNARKFLELYLYFKYPDYTHMNDKLERFFGENKVPPILIDRVNNEYSHLNGSVERAAMPVEVPEMAQIAKLIIEKLKEDSDQYSALMNSINEEL